MKLEEDLYKMLMACLSELLITIDQSSSLNRLKYPNINSTSEIYE